MVLTDEIDTKVLDVDMDYYYRLRREARRVYAYDAAINPRVDDLTSQLLQIRDRNRNIESVDIDTVNYNITIGLAESTTSDDAEKVYDKTKNIIDKFIDNNMRLIEKDITKHEKAKGYKLYDEIVIGNSIQFIL